jgi:hypothetical protein
MSPARSGILFDRHLSRSARWRPTASVTAVSWVARDEPPNQIREYQITKNGIELLDVYRSLQGVLSVPRRQAQQPSRRPLR